MMVSDQPVISMLDQNHAKSSQRCFHLAVPNRAEFIEPGRVGDVVVEHYDPAVSDHDFVPAFCQSGEIAADGLASYIEGEPRRSDENCLRRVKTDQRLDVIGIESPRPTIND